MQQGYTDIVDADLSKYFDNIPHAEPMECVARRTVDRQMLHLIRMWLKVPVEERDETGKRRLRGGKDNDRGAPQGGVVSPLLANPYINRMSKGCRQTRRGEQFRAQIVNYADDFVILSRGKAAEALEWTRGVLERLKLTLNEKKTSIRNARQERGSDTRCPRRAPVSFRRSGFTVSWACSGCGIGLVARVREPAMKSVGKPDAANPHVRFDERGGETGRRPQASVPAPNLDSTEAIADLKSGSSTLTTVTLGEMKIRVFGNTAVASESTKAAN